MNYNPKNIKTKFIVTGAVGFIGKHLVNRLSKDVNNEVFCIDLSFNNWNVEELNSRIKIIQGDVLNQELINMQIRDISPDYIIHLAARKSRTNLVGDFRASLDMNSTSVLNLMEACFNLSSLRRIVLLGTADEYGNIGAIFREKGVANPISAYGISKYTSTLFGKAFWKYFKVPAVTLRPTIAFGPGQGDEMFIPSLINGLLQDKIFEMSKGEQVRNFIYIEDLINAILLALEINCNGQVINIGFSKSYKLKDVARLIESKLGVKNMVVFGALPYREGEIMHYNVDISEAKNTLSWEPMFGLNRGLDETIRYYTSKVDNKK